MYQRRIPLNELKFKVSILVHSVLLTRPCDSPVWRDTYSVRQKTIHLVRNWEVRCCVFKSPPLHHMLSHINPVHTHTVFSYHPKACFPVTPWSLMLRILKGFWRKGFFCVFRTYDMQTACFIHAMLDLMSLIIFCEAVCVGNFVFHPQKGTQAKRVWGTGVDPRERKWQGNGKNYFVSSFMICALRDSCTNEISGLLFIVNLDWLIVWRSACQKVLYSTRVYLVRSDNFGPTACR